MWEGISSSSIKIFFDTIMEFLESGHPVYKLTDMKKLILIFTILLSLTSYSALRAQDRTITGTVIDNDTRQP